MTLTELLLAAGIAALLVYGITRLITRNSLWMMVSGGRQSIQSRAVTCMDNITQRLRNGRARSVRISTPENSTPLIPNSRVDFAMHKTLASGATSFAFYLQDGTVYGQEFIPPIGGQAPQPLAAAVTSLTFATSSVDPGVISISLRMDLPWDKSGNPDHASSIFIPNQTVTMVETE